MGPARSVPFRRRRRAAVWVGACPRTGGLSSVVRFLPQGHDPCRRCSDLGSRCWQVGRRGLSALWPAGLSRRIRTAHRLRKAGLDHHRGRSGAVSHVLPAAPRRRRANRRSTASTRVPLVRCGGRTTGINTRGPTSRRGTTASKSQQTTSHLDQHLGGSRRNSSGSRWSGRVSTRFPARSDRRTPALHAFQCGLPGHHVSRAGPRSQRRGIHRRDLRASRSHGAVLLLWRRAEVAPGRIGSLSRGTPTPTFRPQFTGRRCGGPRSRDTPGSTSVAFIRLPSPFSCHAIPWTSRRWPAPTGPRCASAGRPSSTPPRWSSSRPEWCVPCTTSHVESLGGVRQSSRRSVWRAQDVPPDSAHNQRNDSARQARPGRPTAAEPGRASGGKEASAT
jgi:hypothetical protein